MAYHEERSMNTNNQLPFILRYEEEPLGDSLIDESDHQLFYDPYLGGMVVWTPPVPWDLLHTLKA
jgi:hypothetical protein